MRLRRSWNRLVGTPARLLMDILRRRVPHQEYDGIRLIVADDWLEPSAQRFFDRTREALARAASGAPRAYMELREDIRQVALWGQDEAPPYQRFQFAAVVPPSVALEADVPYYSAWLLYTSGYPHGKDEAHERAEEFLDSIEPELRRRIAEWLDRMMEERRRQ
jgi:hypothetical protein